MMFDPHTGRFAGGSNLDTPAEVSEALADFVPRVSTLPVLHQFRPAWAAQAYLRFAAVPYHVQNRCFPERISSAAQRGHGRYGGDAGLGALPMLADGHFLVPGADVIPHLAREHVDLDSSLTATERADSAAFSAMVGGGWGGGAGHATGLGAALAYFRWADDDGYEKRTLPEMRAVVPAPFRWYMLGALRAAHVAALRSAGHDFASGSSAADRRAAEAMAMAGYRALDARLAERKAAHGGCGSGGDGSGGVFFFRDDAPTMLDALVFGHVADALGDLSLGKVVRGFPHLVAHFELVRDRYFAPEAHRAYGANGHAGGGGGGGGSICTMNCENAFNCLGSAQLTDYMGSVGPAPEPGGTLGGGGGVGGGDACVRGGADRAANPSEFVRRRAQRPKVKKALSEDEKAMAEGSRNFLLCAGMAVLSYLVWGDMITFQFEEVDDDNE